MKGGLADITRYVYVLLDDSGAWRYIGCSAHPERRIRQYFNLPATGVTEWLSSLPRAPERRILEELHPGADWRRAEREWILRALADGQPLLNTTHVPGAFGSGRGYLRRPWWAQRARKRPQVTAEQLDRASQIVASWGDGATWLTQHGLAPKELNSLLAAALRRFDETPTRGEVDEGSLAMGIALGLITGSQLPPPP